MDKIVNDFFDKNSTIKHNKDILPPPPYFLSNNSESCIKKSFYWLRHESRCKSLLLGNSSNLIDIKPEIKKVVPLAIPHREHPGWRSLTIYGYSSIMTNSYEHYKEEKIITDKDETDWTDICNLLPHTVSWLKNMSPLEQFSRIRIMVLDPGFSSTPHRDYYDGQALCGPINIAVINPKGSEFVLEDGGLVPWQEGEIRSMDLGSYHCIRNSGTEPRVHIIITPSKQDWDLKAMTHACRKYMEYYESGRN